MRTRKNLNEIANAYNTTHKTTLGVKAALEADMSEKFAHFQTFMQSPHTEEDVTAALKPVRTAIEVVNDEVRMQRLESLDGMKHKDAVLDYLRTQKVQGVKLEEKEGIYSIVSSAVVLDSYDFISHICSVDLNGIIDSCCIFADNVAKYEFNEETAISKNSMHASYIDLRKRKGWDIPKSKMSKNVLAAQMTEIVNFISNNIGLRMINADVVFVKNGIIEAKDEADKAGKLLIRDERTIVRMIFRAMYTRYNGLAYPFQTKTRAEKSALTTKANKDMAEAPAKVEKAPAASETTVSTTEVVSMESAPAAVVETVKKSAKKA